MEVKINTKYSIGDKVFVVVENVAFEGEVERIDVFSAEFTVIGNGKFGVRYSIKGWVSGKARGGWASNGTWANEDRIFATRKEAEDYINHNRIEHLMGTLNDALSRINSGIQHLRLKDMPDDISKSILHGLIEAKKHLLGTKKDAGVK